MRLYTLIYGNGSDEPLLTEENLAFDNMDAAAKHASETAARLIAEAAEPLGLKSHFALIDELQGEQRRVFFESVDPRSLFAAGSKPGS